MTVMEGGGWLQWLCQQFFYHKIRIIHVKYKKLLAPSQKERNGAAGKKSLKNLFLIGKMMQIGNILFIKHSSSQVLSNQKNDLLPYL